MLYKEDMKIILRTCKIMHNMIVEVRKDDYMLDGTGRLLGTVLSHIIPINCNHHDSTTTSRATEIRSMR